MYQLLNGKLTRGLSGSHSVSYISNGFSIPAGDGKTHYIQKQLRGAPLSLVIAVNESFSPLNAILKLRSLTRDESCDIFFNFTIVPSNVSGCL